MFQLVGFGGSGLRDMLAGFVSGYVRSTSGPRSTLNRFLAVVRNADTLNRDCQAAGRTLGLRHHRCEPGTYETGDHLGREAMHHDKHFLAVTAWGIGQH